MVHSEKPPSTFVKFFPRINPLRFDWERIHIYILATAGAMGPRRNEPEAGIPIGYTDPRDRLHSWGHGATEQRLRARGHEATNLERVLR